MFRAEYGHTPLSIEEEIPWKCQRLVIGTGDKGARFRPASRPLRAGGTDKPIRLAELIAAPSLATDLGIGQPMENLLRTYLLALEIGGVLKLNLRT